MFCTDFCANPRLFAPREGQFARKVRLALVLVRCGEMGGMKFWLRWIVSTICLLVLPAGFAQQVSFHITPLRPVAELRTEALKPSRRMNRAPSANLTWWS